MRRPHIVLVSREVWPFMPGGGIGRGVRDTALALAGTMDVTVVTSDRYRTAHAALAADSDSWVAQPGIEFAWATEQQDDPTPLWSLAHAWSAACLDALLLLVERRRVDLVEFGDYGGAAAVTLQSRRSGEARLADVPVVVRAHTTWEMAEALDRRPAAGLAARVVIALERQAFALADALVVPGPSTARAFELAYGEEALPPRHVARPGFVLPPAAPESARPAASGPLRLLFVGRLQHLKGADTLVAAVRALPDVPLQLTLVGRDAPSGPLGTSMREHLEAIAAGDERVVFAGPVAPEDLPAVIRAHDLLVAPSIFESFGYVLREANAENRPALVTPVGGLRDGLVEGRGGWLTAGVGAEPLAAALRDLVAHPERVRDLAASGQPRAVAEDAARPELVAGDYRNLLAAVPPKRPEAPLPPRPVWALVTAVDTRADLVGTLRSLAAQDDEPRLRVIVAADAETLVPTDALDDVDELVFVPPGPDALTRARAAALERLPEDLPVLLLRAGEQLAPGALARLLGALAADPEAAFASAFAPGRRSGRAPFSAGAGVILGQGEGSASVPLFRPGVLSAKALGATPPGAEDPDATLFAFLADEGRTGVIVPELLVTRATPRRLYGRQRANDAPLPSLGGPSAWAAAG